MMDPIRPLTNFKPWGMVLLLASLLLTACGDDDDDDNDEPTVVEGSYDLFVTSNKGNVVNRYNGDTGEFIEVFINTTAGLVGPQEVILGYDGNLLVSAIGNSQVKRFDVETGQFLGDFTNGYTLVGPTKMRFGPDSLLYVSQWSDNQSSVAVFNGSTGAFIREATGNHNTTMGQAFRDNHLYVAVWGDGQNGEILQYDDQANLLGSFPASNAVRGPVNLRFDGDELLVEDWSAGSIIRFNATTGARLGVFISGLQNIEGSMFGPDGAYYACDWGQGNVKKFDGATGQSLGVFTSGGALNEPNSLLFRKR